MTTQAPVPTVVPADLSTRLSGRLVTVEPLAPEHDEGLLAAGADPETFRWMPVDMSSPEGVRTALGDFRASAQVGSAVPYAVRDAGDGVLIGTTSFLALALSDLRAEIGFTWLAPSRWGGGANVETKLLLLGHAFETVGLRRVEFKTDSRNERSRGALTALGAQFEGIFRKHMVMPDGSPRDSAYYSVTDEDWPMVRAGLHRRLEAAA